MDNFSATKENNKKAHMKFLAVPTLTLVIAAHLMAAEPGALRGSVVTTSGQPVGYALITLKLISGQPTTGTITTHSSEDGSYTVSGIPRGQFEVCVRSGDRVLDPCRWTTPTHVAIAGSGLQTVPPITVGEGRRLRLHVINAEDVTDPSRHVLFGVWRRNGLFVPLPVRQIGSSSVTRELFVPRDEDLQLSVHCPTGMVLISPATGTLTHAGNTLLQITAGKSDLEYTVRIEPLTGK